MSSSESHHQPVTAADVLESRLTAWFRRAVRLAGGYTFKLAPTEAGIPDRLVIMPGGRMYLVELKTTSGRPSAIQHTWHNRIRRVGGAVVVLYGKEEAALWLLDPDRKRPRRHVRK